MNHTFYADPGTWWTEWQLGISGNRSETTGGQFMNRNVQPWHLVRRAVCSRTRSSAQVRTARSIGTGVVYELESAYTLRAVPPAQRPEHQHGRSNSGEQIDFTNSRLADQRRYRPQVD